MVETDDFKTWRTVNYLLLNPDKPGVIILTADNIGVRNLGVLFDQISLLKHT